LTLTGILESGTRVSVETKK